MLGSVAQINVSSGGLPKLPVLFAEAGPRGLAEDWHRHPRIHGGPRKALLLITLEGIEELGLRGYPVVAGSLGENITSQGLDRRQIRLGQRFQVGACTVRIESVRQPCSALQAYGAGLPATIYDSRVKRCDASSPLWGLSGFYCAVLTPGVIRPADPIRLLD